VNETLLRLCGSPDIAAWCLGRGVPGRRSLTPPAAVTRQGERSIRSTWLYSQNLKLLPRAWQPVYVFGKMRTSCDGRLSGSNHLKSFRPCVPDRLRTAFSSTARCARPSGLRPQGLTHGFRAAFSSNASADIGTAWAAVDVWPLRRSLGTSLVCSTPGNTGRRRLRA
jgi:hypothetical protein